MSDLLLNAVITWLLTKTDLTDLVDTRIWKSNVRSVDNGPLNISGKSAIVVDVSGGDSPTMNSLGFPRVVFKIYSDHTRNVSGDITKYDGVDKMWVIFRILNNHLHIVGMEPVLMDGYNVINSFRGIEPNVINDDDVGMPFLFVSYDMKVVY